MPTTVSKDELDELRDLINQHIESTGESVTSIADRAGVRRQLVSYMRSGNYGSNPTLDVFKKIAEAIGKKIRLVDTE